jgi:hypothetical protein
MLVIASEVTKQMSFSSNVSSSAWVLVGSMPADVSSPPELLKSIAEPYREANEGHEHKILKSTL